MEFFSPKRAGKKKKNREKPQKWERIQLRALRNPWEEAGGNPLESPGERGPGIKGNVLPGILRGLTALACESEPDPGGKKKKKKSHYPRKINRDFNKGKPRRDPSVRFPLTGEAERPKIHGKLQKKNPQNPSGLRKPPPRGAAPFVFPGKKGAFQA